MKIKKRILSLALACTMALGLMPGMTMTALADGTTSYTLTIPSTLTVANKGWNGTDGISATGTLESGKKLTVTASSANNFALKSGSNSVGYKMATASTDTTAITSWEFTELSNTATTKTMGIIVDDYSSKPAGTYQDTVTFTAKVETARQLHSFTLTGPYTHQSLVVEFYDGDKWSDMVAKYSLITNPAREYVGFSSDGFITKNGSWVKMTDTVDPNATYYVE